MPPTQHISAKVHACGCARLVRVLCRWRTLPHAGGALEQQARCATGAVKVCPSTAPMIRVLSTLFPIRRARPCTRPPCTSQQPSVLHESRSPRRHGTSAPSQGTPSQGARPVCRQALGAVRGSASCSAHSTWLPGYQIHLAVRKSAPSASPECARLDGPAFRWSVLAPWRVPSRATGLSGGCYGDPSAPLFSISTRSGTDGGFPRPGLGRQLTLSVKSLVSFPRISTVYSTPTIAGWGAAPDTVLLKECHSSTRSWGSGASASLQRWRCLPLDADPLSRTRIT